MACGLCAAGTASAEQAWRAYWQAETVWQRNKAAESLQDGDFAPLYQRLSAGRPYTADVPTGIQHRRRLDDRGVVFPYFVLVPETYDPQRRYPVRVVLHGSIQRPRHEDSGDWWRRHQPFRSQDMFTVFPAAWDEAPWWSPQQVENIDAILKELRRIYNLDENRVYCFGVSDGGTGTFFMAFKHTTPFAAFFPFIGHPNVLNHPGSRADGQVYATNLINKPLFVVNGEQDTYYPAAEVSLYLELFRRAGVDFVYRAKPGGHTVQWWPEESENIAKFQSDNPRDPFPDEVRWSTELTSRYHRAHWVIIEELGAAAGQSKFEDPNDLRLPGSFADSAQTAFPRAVTAGHIYARRVDNSVDVRTQGVRRYRLLLSPTEFDFRSEVIVYTNGKLSFRGVLKPNPKVLFNWASRDEDRTMLVGAEVVIELEAAGTEDDQPPLAPDR